MRHAHRPWGPILALMILLLPLTACGGGEDTAQARDGGSSAAQEAVQGARDVAQKAAEHAQAANEAAGAESSVEPIQVIGHGQEVDVTRHLATGRTTVVDFYSEYCPPCKRIAPYLEKLHAKGGDVAVLKVDINRPGVKGIDWGSPVARQYKLSSIPHFKIYDADGELVAEGQAAYQKVIGYLQDAGVDS